MKKIREQRKDPAEGVVRGDAVVEWQKSSQPIQLESRPLHYAHSVVCSAGDRASATSSNSLSGCGQLRLRGSSTPSKTAKHLGSTLKPSLRIKFSKMSFLTTASLPHYRRLASCNRPGIECRRQTALILICILCALSAGCRQEIIGSPEPPKEFGPVAWTLFGCPSMQGVFAWPPVAGEYSVVIPSNRTPWDGAIPIFIYGKEMQIWIKHDKNIVFRSRKINRMSNVNDVLTRKWSLKEYSYLGYSCSSSMLEFDAINVDINDNYGGKGIRRGFKLVRLKDGAIAVGIKTISHGRTSSIYSWGQQSSGSFNIPDAVYWSWSKLARIGAGDTEPAPMDAYRETAPSGQ